MIDDKTALQWELDAEEAGLTQHAEIIRHARRYLAMFQELPAFFVPTHWMPLPEPPK